MACPRFVMSPNGDSFHFQISRQDFAFRKGKTTLQNVAETTTDEAVLHRGVVFKKSQGQYDVEVDGGMVPCSISNRLRKQLLYPIADASSLHQRVVSVADINVVDPIAVGDVVHFVPSEDGAGMITEVLPRKNRLTRRAAGPKPLEQTIVANADQLLAVVAAARPAPSWELLDRYLAAAEEAEMPACVVITKIDLVDPAEFEDEMENYRGLGYRAVLTSATTGEGIDRLKAELRGKISVLAGKSGVGKTSLLNLIQPGLGLRVNETSKLTGKGKHATTHLEMFPLDVGGAIVDTPGMREFGLWNVDEMELAQLFPELRDLAGLCRFGLDCSHSHEPGCRVQVGVKEGAITERRYRSFLRIAASLK
jgi:ribosome biogenesis GTPase / thiamine phosphate phosphatase